MSAFRDAYDLVGWVKSIDLRLSFLERHETAAGAFVGARYYASDGLTISNAVQNIVQFNNETYDTHDAVTTGASWKFTAPVDGYYLVSANMKLSGCTGWAGTEVFYINLYVEGAWYSQLGMHPGVQTTSSILNSINGADVCYLAAADYCDVRYYQNSGFDLTTSSTQANYINIVKVG